MIMTLLLLQALANQKKKVEEEKNLGASLQREIQILSESCEDVEKKRQKIAQELQIKDNKLSIVEGQLSHSKAQLDTELQKVKQMHIT